MASTIKIKRSNVAGKAPTTSDIDTGELALNIKDQKLYSSNGSAVFQIGGASANGAVTITTATVKDLTQNDTVVTNVSSYANTVVDNSLLSTKASWDALTSTNTAIRALANDRLQVANAAATYQTISIERAALANTNARITLVNNNLTATNTAIRALDAQKLSVANATTLLAAKATWSGLTSTNTALRTLISDRLQVANAVSIYQTKSVERAALANTNAYIATKLNSSSYTAADVLSKLITVDGSGSGLDADLLDGQSSAYFAVAATENSRLANTNAYIATKLNASNPTITGTLTANGSVGTAGYVLKSSGSGIYWGAAAAGGGSSVWSTNGSNAYYTTGSVGIGTSSPSSLLHLSTTGPAILTIEADTDNVTESDNARIVLKQDGGGVNARIGYASGANALEIINEFADSLYLGTSNATKLTIDSSGNVGIGTGSPSLPLVIEKSADQASIRLNRTSTYTGTDTVGQVLFSYEGDSIANVLAARDGANDAAALTFGTQPTGGSITERMRIDSAGNIGIGTTSTSNKKLGIVNDRAINVYSQIWSMYNGATFENDVVLGFDGTDASFGNYQSKGLKFLTNNQSRIYINNSGNVGIGTGSPSQLLHVAGIGYASTDFRAPIFYDSDNTGNYVDPASTSILNAVVMSNMRPGVNTWHTSYNDNANRFYFGSSARTYFGSQNGYEWRSSTDGNIGILDNSGNFYNYTSVRSPIFYDNNNTSYYVDPASTSVLYNLALYGTVYMRGAESGQTLTDGATISWDTDSGRIAFVTLAGNRTIAAPTNAERGSYVLHVIQDGTGSRTLTWNAVFKWPGGVAPVLSTGAGKRDIFFFTHDGTNFYGSYVNDVR